MSTRRFKNTTNIYRINEKNLRGRDDTLLSKIYGSNPSFHGPRVGREKTREEGGRKGRSLGKKGWVLG
jgi:hypothetical protein